jgi:MOSC domain-containing protein YiiM
MRGLVLSVAARSGHGIGKDVTDEITLLPGRGIKGDAHCGATVRHQSRDPEGPNLRQVHLMSQEILDALSLKGFTVKPGQIGENILTEGVDLPNLPEGSLIRFGSGALIALTGRRNPCVQLDDLKPGLMAICAQRSSNGTMPLIGVMGVVLSGGIVRPGAEAIVRIPPAPHTPLQRV